MTGNISDIQTLSLSPMETLKSLYFAYKVNFDSGTLMPNLNHDHYILGTNFNQIFKENCLVICRE